MTWIAPAAGIARRAATNALDPGQQFGGVGSAELPPEWRGGLVVLVLDVGQPVLDVIMVGGVSSGSDDFALEDGEEDLCLAEPGWVDWRTDRYRMGVVGCEAAVRRLAWAGRSRYQRSRTPGGLRRAVLAS